MVLEDKKSLEDIELLLNEYLTMFFEIKRLEKETGMTYDDVRTSSDELHGVYIRLHMNLEEIRDYYYTLKNQIHKEDIEECINLIRRLNNDSSLQLCNSSFNGFHGQDYENLRKLLDSLEKHS